MSAVLQGELAAFRLPDVLTFLCTTRKSGALVVGSYGKTAQVYYREGSLVYATSNQEPFRLGAVLLRKKKITREQRDAIDALMQRDGGRFGALAVQERVLTESQLRDFLKVQASEIVFDAFVWHEGTFTFDGTMALPEHAVTISVDLGNLIMEGARRIEEWAQCVRLLPDPSLVFRVVATPRDEKITLTVDEWKILFLINGQRTIDDLCRDSDEDPLVVYRVLYGLYANKLIETASQRVPDDATVRQNTPQFGAESTVRDQEQNDDTSLLVSSQAHLSYADVVRPVIAQLTISLDGSVVPLTESEYLIGRHRENTIQLTDPGVSGFHARLYRGPEGYVVEDLKSRNGTWINGERVLQMTLTSGDRVHVGTTDLLYEVLLSG
jgi:pSer/pThr/pTyr-binding forkhead associated (FHA) protein